MNDMLILSRCLDILGITQFNPRRTKITSPFRPDRNPGCYFWITRNGKVFFVDWASEETHIHISEFYRRLSGGNFYSVKAELADVDHSSFSRSIIQIIERGSKKHEELAELYFSRYGISYGDIKTKYGLFTVRKYKILKADGESKEFIVGDDELCLCLWQNGSGRLKLYYPFRKRGDKRMKRFISTLKGQDIEFLSRTKNKLIITKSKKDAIMLDLLYGCEYDICWVQSETLYPDHRFIARNFAIYNEICIFFDQDETGIAGAEKFVKSIRNLFPRKNIYARFMPEELGFKDPSDYIENYISEGA